MSTTPTPEQLRYAAQALTRASEYARDTFEQLKAHNLDLHGRFSRHAMTLQCVASYLFDLAHGQPRQTPSEPTEPPASFVAQLLFHACDHAARAGVAESRVRHLLDVALRETRHVD